MTKDDEGYDFCAHYIPRMNRKRLSDGRLMMIPEDFDVDLENRDLHIQGDLVLK